MTKPRSAASDLLRKRARAAAQAPVLQEMLRGTLRRRYIRCGKPHCRCRKGRGHGPFFYLAVTLGVGRTRQITIAAPDRPTARRYLRNYRRLLQMVEVISSLNRELLRLRRLPRKPSGRKIRRRSREGPTKKGRL